jgi:hypothetical protein
MKSHFAQWPRSLAALALLTMLAACDDTKHYPTSTDAARAKLVGTTIPDIAFGSSAHSGPGEATADGVQWAVEIGPADGLGGDPVQGIGDKVMMLKAMLVAAGDGTDLTVDLTPPPHVDPAKFKALFDQHPGMDGMFRNIVQEQADSVLTNRPFSYANVSASMALAVLSELPNIRQQLDEDRKIYEQHERDTMDHAYDAAK